MADKIRPCFGGIVRHKWQWLRNVTVTSLSANSGSISIKGRYGCVNCGARKTGPMNHNAPDDAARSSAPGSAVEAETKGSGDA